MITPILSTPAQSLKGLNQGHGCCFSLRTRLTFPPLVLKGTESAVIGLDVVDLRITSQLSQHAYRTAVLFCFFFCLNSPLENKLEFSCHKVFAGIQAVFYQNVDRKFIASLLILRINLVRWINSSST